eukprot:2336488-Pyramimonas_sp.AAC.1
MLGQKASKPLETSPQNGRERDCEITHRRLPFKGVNMSASLETSSKSATKAKDVGTENKQTA